MELYSKKWPVFLAGPNWHLPSCLVVNSALSVIMLKEFSIQAHFSAVRISINEYDDDDYYSDLCLFLMQNAQNCLWTHWDSR